MATRQTLTDELARRLGDTEHTIWLQDLKKSLIDFGIKSLYPFFFVRKVATTVPGAGPLQTKPVGARNLYQIGLKRNAEAKRIRKIRYWNEGDADANVPRLQLDAEEGALLVWSWTEGWDAPATDGEVLVIPTDSEEVVVVRAHIAALELLLSDRVNQEKYFAIRLRQGVTEEDVALTLDALHESLTKHLERRMLLPEVQA